MEFTSEQRKAIDTRGCNVLVSAAAGSGKTGVLTERILSRLRQGDNIDEFLVLTFTRAAAGEMKKRVRDKIQTAAAECDASERSFWQKQLTLIGDAPITTIHSFCLRLLRRHYNLLPGLDPKFHLTDPHRAAILRDDLLSAYLEECYTEQDEEKRERCFDLLRLYGSRLSDDGLKNEILRLMDFGCSRGDTDVWLDGACRRFGDLDFWYETAMTDARECIELLMKETLRDIELLEKRGGSDGCIETLKNDLCALSELKAAEWDELISVSPFGRKKPRKKEDDPELDEYMKQRREKRKEYFGERVQSVFTQPFRAYAEEISELVPQMETLARMTKEFWHRYSEEKLKKSALDFDDLEIYTLRLLSENPSLSEEYKAFFKEVLVDEYQDINPLQDKILSYLAGERRLFAVGDIKQSIYGFRLADHTLFHSRSTSYRKDEPNEKGLLIPLNKNFRSRKEVLSLTNAFFSGLMNEDVSGITYGEDEALRFGAEYYKEKHGTCAEIILVERPRGDVDGEYDNLSCHGRYVARKILQMMEEGFTVKENDTERPLRFSDITVLMRSANAHGETVGTAISDMGIPVQIPSKMGFLSGRETKLIRSFLAVLDNPMQDIPLAAVMRSPLFSFDEDELLVLALDRKGRKLWDMVLCAEDSDREQLNKEKVAAFRETVELWRQYARVYPVGELVDMFLKRFDYSAFWGGLPNGRQRIKNIRLFGEEAFAFQNDDGGGLFDFLRYLDHLVESEGDVREESESEDDCVRIMNIHKSKGLEFPVVFLIQTEKKFNKTDLSVPLLIDKDLGFGPQYKDMARRLVSPTLPRLLIRGRKDKNDLAEEMRILYVALTRAKEKLIITASDVPTPKTSVNGRLIDQFAMVRYDDGAVLPASMLIEDNTYYHWLLHSLGKGADRAEVPLTQRDDAVFQIVEALAADTPVVAEKPKRILAPEEFERLTKILSAPKQTSLPAKVSVTELLPKGSWERDRMVLRRPRFLADRKELTAAEKGTAFHLLMEYLPLEQALSEEELHTFVDGLRAEGILRDDAADSVDISTVAAFLDSSYGRELIASPQVKRELSFVCAFPADELFCDIGQDDRSVILQGAVDLIYQRGNGEWVLIDYKTNDISRCGKDAFLGKYGRQMDLYCAAMERVFGISVAEKAFFLTKTREFIRYESGDRSI